MATQDTATAPQNTPNNSAEDASPARALAAKIDAAMAEEVETGEPQPVVSLKDEAPPKVKAIKQEKKVEEPKAEVVKDDVQYDPLTKREMALREKRLALEEQELADREEELAAKRSKRAPKQEDPDSDEAFEKSLDEMLDAEYGDDSPTAKKLERKHAIEMRKRDKKIEAMEKRISERDQKEYVSGVEKEFAELVEKHTIPESKRGRLAEILLRVSKEEKDRSWQDIFAELAPAFQTGSLPEAEPKAAKAAPMRSSTSAKFDRDIPHTSARRNGDVPKAPLGNAGLYALAESMVED